MSKIIESIALSFNQAQDWFIALPWYFQIGIAFSLTIILTNIIIRLISVWRTKGDRGYYS